MKKVTILLTDDLDARLRLEARRRGVAVADLARKAVEQFVHARDAAGRLSFVALGEGGQPDASERTDVFVAHAVRDHRLPPPRELD